MTGYPDAFDDLAGDETSGPSQWLILDAALIGDEASLAMLRIIESQIIRREGCWGWTGKFDPDGYARFSFHGRHVRAGRAIVSLTTGPVPSPLVVRHTCDNPPCVNPAHLLTGTNQDNMADKMARNRQAKGEGNGRAKLTESDVRDIRDLHAAGSAIRSLAREYRVNQKAVQLVVRRETWKHVAPR